MKKRKQWNLFTPITWSRGRPVAHAPDCECKVFLLGVRDGTLEQAAAVCDRNEEKASAAEIRALKVGRE